MAIRHDIHTRIYLNGDWRDVTDDVLVRDGINIVRGRPDEATETLPQTCDLTLDNRSGDYSVRDPNGQWYGYVGRGNPLEVCKYLAQDAASTAVTGGWGTTETGTSGVLSTYSWTVTGGSTSDYAKASGKATHAVTSTNVRRLSYLPTFSQRDVDVTVTVSVNVTNITGGSIATDVVVRGVSLDPLLQVAARLIITTAEEVQVDLVDGNGDTWAEGPRTVTGITHTLSQALKIRAQAEGQALRAKVWIATAGEPVGWDYVWTNVAPDADPIAYTRGWVGVGSVRYTGNTNGTVTFSYDDFLVASPRFAGEVVNYETGGDPSARERHVRVQAAGVIRRLLQGKSPLQSALRRYLSLFPTGNTFPTHYWPLEDEKLAVAEEVLATRGDTSLAFQLDSLNSGVIEWAADNRLPGSVQSPELRDGGRLEANFDASISATNWTVFWAMKTGIETGAQVLFYTTSPVFQFTLVFYTSGLIEGYLTKTDPLNPVLIFSYTIPVGTYDDTWHDYVLSVDQNGGSAEFVLYVDGANVASGSDATTMAGLTRALFAAPAGTSEPIAVGHVAMWPTQVDPAPLHEAATGFAGDVAGRRLQRLCDENNIEFTWVGYIDGTAEMGPQSAVGLTELLRECAAVDQGTLYEAKGSVGLIYKTRDTAYGQTPLLTLDVAQKQVGHPFEPVEDDQFIVNNVLTQRTFGGTYEVELTSGPLSSANPPDGVGRYDTQLDVNAYTDEQLPDIANWRLALGTVDEPRFPGLWLDLDASEAQQFEDEVLDLTPDDLVTIENAGIVGVYQMINVLARGYTEFWTNHRHTISINASPYGPNNVIVLDTSRLNAEDITINEDLDTTETGVGTVIATDDALWNTSDLPYDIVIGGEQMTVTAVSGSSSPQTLTVTRSVNGVVKTHSTGATVLLATPYYLGR